MAASIAKVIETPSQTPLATRMIPKSEMSEFIRMLRLGRTLIEREEPNPRKESALKELEKTMRFVVRKCRGHIHPRDMTRIEDEIFRVREYRRSQNTQASG